jgi:hypothetical protein
MNPKDYLSIMSKEADLLLEAQRRQQMNIPPGGVGGGTSKPSQLTANMKLLISQANVIQQQVEKLQDYLEFLLTPIPPCSADSKEEIYSNVSNIKHDMCELSKLQKDISKSLELLMDRIEKDI